MEGYIVSARKYRPNTFESVVGQEHVTRTLLNEIRSKHLAQAFLFNGPRGVGKTTCARILAREINKESVPDESYDFSFNIFELDAASNNSVDDIRLLNEQVRIPPQVGSHKVYIIDEVHMLSAQAFNAFLKTLEEPPPYAVFILATTERHKILPTILSRCQVFNFNRITISDMVAHLQGIATKEGIEAEEEALHIIAQKADGALRDALSIFDQMASVGNGSIRYADVIENLSVLDYDQYFELTDAFLAQDVSSVLKKFDEILQRGFDGQIFLNGLSNHFRDIMVGRDPATVELLDVPPSVRQKYLSTAAKLSQGFLVNAINIANAFDLNYKSSRNQRLHVELALIKICYLPALLSADEKKKLRERLGGEQIAEAAVQEVSHPPKKTEEGKPDTGATMSQPTKPEPVLVEESSPEPLAQKREEESLEVEKPIVKYAEQTKPDGKVARIGNLNSILAEAPTRPTAPVEEEKKEEEVIQEIQPVTTTSVESALTNFASELAAQDQTRLVSIFKFASHEIVEEQALVRLLLNKQHRVQLEDVRTDLLLFLRKELNNPTVQLEFVEVKKKTQSERAYTSQEKFEAMAKKNPELMRLKEALKLEIE